MAHMPARIRFTYKDYKSLPDDQRCELLDGELIKMTSPSTRHQDISRNLLVQLDSVVRRQGLGKVYAAPLDVVLGEDVVQPDLLYISQDRLHIVAEEEIRGAPDLVIEILSSSTAQRDRGYKQVLYARHGVREYWLADPDKETIEVLVLEANGFRIFGTFSADRTLRSSTLADLAIPLDQVF